LCGLIVNSSSASLSFENRQTIPSWPDAAFFPGRFGVMKVLAGGPLKRGEG